MQEHLAPSFGEILRQLRISRGLSLNDLAYETALHKGMLSKLENDKQLPSAEVIGALSSVLQVPLADLYRAAGLEAFQPLPSLRPYLRQAYNVSDEIAENVEAYLRQQGAADLSGPTDGEDELLE